MESKNENIILKTEEQSFIVELKQIIQSARKQAYSAINLAQVCANWLLGQFYLEFQNVIIEQAVPAQFKTEKGQAAPDLCKGLGNKKEQTLSAQFATTEKGQAAPALLPWSNYERLMRVKMKNSFFNTIGNEIKQKYKLIEIYINLN